MEKTRLVTRPGAEAINFEINFRSCWRVPFEMTRQQPGDIVCGATNQQHEEFLASNVEYISSLVLHVCNLNSANFF